MSSVSELTIGNNIKAKFFRRGLQQAKKVAGSMSLSATVQASTTTPALPPEPAIQKYHRLIEVSPSISIVEAWRDIEIELAKLRQLYGLEARPGQPLDQKMSDELKRRGVFTTDTLFVLDQLRKLRNEAAHTDVSLTKDDAEEYADLAVLVLAKLQSAEP